MDEKTRNGVLAAQHADTGYALAHLARRGAAIVSVEIGKKDRPLIVVARPVRGIDGQEVARAFSASKEIITYRGRCDDCDIQWSVPHE